MRVRPLVSLGACLGALATVLAPVIAGFGTAAQALTTDQDYWAPVAKQVVVRGHGYGHGHGMSQYGAEGAALQGLTYKQIAAFYYPGTSWSSFTGSVRVLISADTGSDTVVSPAAGLTVTDLGTGTSYPVPTVQGATRWRLNVDADGHTVVGYLTTAWHRWSPGGHATLSGDGQFAATGPLRLWTPYGSHVYRGALRAASPSKGSHDRDTVNVVAMDDYVQGVVPSEMPASWSAEAVRAQAVAARTYATWSRAQNVSRYYQICDTPSCQVYGGVDAEDPRGNAAVQATAGAILTYQGKPAFTQFSSSSGGWTSAGSVPYLPAKADPYDDFAGNYLHEWTKTVDLGVLERSYPRIGTLQKVHVVERDGNGQWRGRVWSLVLVGTGGTQEISGYTFQSLFGLRSTWFSIDPTPIIERWTDLGGARSVLGPATSAEQSVKAGTAQTFGNGKIFWSAATGAHEVYGPIYTAYKAMGDAGSALGLPTTGIQSRQDGFRARFVGGAIWSNPRTGTVPVVGTAVLTAYLGADGVYGALGWPTRTNRTTSYGQRVDFEHGWISYDTGTKQATVHPSR